MITRTLSPKNLDSDLINILARAEVCITNLEAVIPENRGYPAAASGGTWVNAEPEVLETLKNYGFNLIGWANNHTLDFLQGGLLATKTNLKKYNFRETGAGKNLAEAASPAYLESEKGRTALIAVTTGDLANNNDIAGEQRHDFKGRPGVNLLRYHTIYHLPEAKLKLLKEIAEKLQINAAREMNIAEGFELPPPEDIFQLGEFWFKKGTSEQVETLPYQKDMSRIEKSIKTAQQQADYIIISVHCHEMKGKEKDKPPEFLELFARRCIEQGASAIVGHGPHILRGLEIYQGKPIFYSLGNFIYQSDTVKRQPADAYEKYGLGREDEVDDLLLKISNDYQKGHYTDKKMFESIVPCWTMENDKLIDLIIYPIELGFELPVSRKGWPKITDNTSSLERLKELSRPYGTEIKIAAGRGVIEKNDENGERS